MQVMAIVLAIVMEILMAMVMAIVMAMEMTEKLLEGVGCDNVCLFVCDKDVIRVARETVGRVGWKPRGAAGRSAADCGGGSQVCPSSSTSGW